MSHKRFSSPRIRSLPTIAFAILALCWGCGAAVAQAADPPPGATDGGSMDGILRALDLKPKSTAAPAFVRATRPDTAHDDFIPVGRVHPERPVKVMTPAEIQAETAALDGDRISQQRRAGIKPLPVPLKKTKQLEDAAPASSVR